MRLSAADRLGPYEILAPIGAGGMGEVYRARDTRLERTVAIKVSSAQFSERFQREAQAIASLNHPNICTLHDVGPDYLVMEFIEGAQLRGPLPIKEVLQHGIQIAEALSHAHRHGVIHRDLKPSNILINKSGVKVLDFGLAKFSHNGARTESGASLAATLTQHTITQEGTIVGTPQYMAPEQFEGRDTDARSDIFAFGLVLYEMTTGRPAFQGKTRASLIAAILAAEPAPVTTLQPLVPPALDHLIRTCLAKDPDDRQQSMHDVLLELKWIAEGGSEAGIAKPVIERRRRRERLAWLVASLATAAALALAFVHFSRKPAAIYPVRFELALPPKVNVLGAGLGVPAISPDGRKMVFVGAGAASSGGMLWLRRMDSPDITPLAGTEGAFSPFWSPDSRFVAYIAEGKLKKIDVSGSPPQTLCDLLPNSLGGSWNRDGVILIGRAVSEPIYQASATGGGVKPLMKLDAARKERAQSFPHFLPDGRHFLYLSSVGQPDTGSVYISSIESPAESRLLVNADSQVNFASPGFLVFARGTTLLAQPFDPGKLQITGEAFPIAQPVGRSPTALVSLFSTSLNGTLAYRMQPMANLQVTWSARNGKRLGAVGETRPYRQGSLSPDEKRLAVQISDTKIGTTDIWLLELSSDILSRVSSNPREEDTPVWTPDGRELVFSSSRSGVQNLYRKVVGGGDEEPLLPTAEVNYPAQFIKDGSLLFMNLGGRSFYRLAPGAGAKPQTLLKTEYQKDGLRVSPDGRWAAYNTNESGRWEVYIASFPDFTSRRQVSNNGGVQGYWRKDGRELFYLTLDGTLTSVPVKPGAQLEAGIPEPLFSTRIPVTATFDQFAVTADGQRFLLFESVESEAKLFTIVLNWPALFQ